ncbi:MAG: hypothetical protein AAF989_06655 [Planctomycetota bacterium]
MKCSKCGKVWNTKAEEDETEQKVDVAAKMAGIHTGKGVNEDGTKKTSPAVLAFAVVAAIAGICGLGFYIWSGTGTQSNGIIADEAPAYGDSPEPDPDDVVWVAPEYREINMPEEKRKSIYMDTRKTAATSIEAPLLLLGVARTTMEKTLQQTYDAELRKLAALHDIPIEDMKQLVNEGDAKKWDPSPRSNAKRNGKRIYPKSWSVGWTK